MKDPGTEIVKAFYDLLDGNTTLPVYSMIPKGVDDFIFIGDLTMVEDIAKDKYITDNTLQIEAIKTYRDQGTKTEVNADINTIIQLVRDNFASTVTLTSFTVNLVVLDGLNDFVEETDEYKIYRKFVRFRLIIEEN